MANRLIKQTAVKVTPGVVGTPSVPGYCVWEKVPPNPGIPDVVADIKINIAAKEVKTFESGYGSYTYVGSMYSSLSQAVYAAIEANRLYEFYPVRVCYPAIKGTPSIPSKIEYNSVSGWNAGGRSVSTMPGDGYAEFEVAPLTVGAVVGLSSGFNGVNPGQQTHAFYAHGGLLDIMESGQVVHSIPAPNLAARPRLRVMRKAGVVSYLINGTKVYTSAAPSSGNVYLDASLYSSSDYVDSPVLAVVAAGKASGRVGITAGIDRRGRASGKVGISGSVRGRTGSRVYCSAGGSIGIQADAIGIARHYGTAEGVLSISGECHASSAQASNIAPRFMLSSGDTVTSGAEVRYAGWQSESAGGYPEVLSAGCDAVAPPFLGVAIVLSGGVGGVQSVAPSPAGKSGSHAFGDAVTAWGSYRSYSFDPRYSADAIAVGEALFMGDTFEPSAEVMAEFGDVLNVGDSWVVELILEQGAEWLEALLLSSDAAAVADADAEFESSIYLTDQNTVRNLGGVQYATNIHTGAITRYTDFDFMSIRSTPDGCFGVRADGIYRISHEPDASQPIDLIVDFGATDFGTSQLKRIDAMYFGMTTDGSVLAVLRADDGEDYTYRVASRDATLRALTGKGAIGRKWRLRLEVYEATQAELDTVELSVNRMNRRLK